jgi:hypothetical protein
VHYLPAKVIAIEKQGDQYQVIVQISMKYRGSFNTLAFGEIKPYSGSLKDGRLDLAYYRDPGLAVGDPFPLWTFTDEASNRSRPRRPAFAKASSFPKAKADRTSASSVEPLS